MFGETKAPANYTNSEFAREAAFYNEDYYIAHKTSNYTRPYEWGNFQHIAIEWAKMLIEGFPMCRTFLDVGCARGFLERAFLEVQENMEMIKDGKPLFTMRGFDHSPFAIANAEEKSRPFVQCAGVDEFEFDQDYDVMLCFDVLGHLTERQSRDWLSRSRPRINKFLFAVIELHDERQYWDATHVNLQTRGWWHDFLLSCGWQQDWEAATMQEAAMQDRFVRNSKCEVFVYKSRL